MLAGCYYIGPDDKRKLFNAVLYLNVHVWYAVALKVLQQQWHAKPWSCIAPALV